MHARFQELLNLRDGEPVSVETALHVADCRDCGLELARLARLRTRLRQLPMFEPPPRIGAAIRETADRPTPAPLRSARFLSLAAVFVAAIALLLFWRMRPELPQVDTNDAAGVDAAIEPLVERSQQLEQLLRGLPHRPSVERAATSAAIDGLQASIQVLDLQLAAAPENGLDERQTQHLWSERVQLLDSLVNVRYAEAARGGYWPTTGAL